MAGHVRGDEGLDIKTIDRARILKAADKCIAEAPVTITSSQSPRSTGGKHDYFSEGDYWWPDPKNPEGPYIQRDGMSNPDNFTAHRQYLMRLSLQVPALTAAWMNSSGGVLGRVVGARVILFTSGQLPGARVN